MEMEETAVLPEANKAPAATDDHGYVIVAKCVTSDAVQLIEAGRFWKDVKKLSNELPEGLTIVEVLRVTARHKPQFKTVVQF